MKKPKKITIKTGTTEEFMTNVKDVMRAADRKNIIHSAHTLTFVDPREMLHFLTDKKIELIHLIRSHPDSITNIALAAKRNRAAVYRDICEMKKFGLVTIHEEINKGHGRHKIVELAADKLKLEASI